MPLLCLSVAWITGILIGSVFFLPLWTVSLSVIPLLFLPFLRNQGKRIILASSMLLLLLGSAVYSNHAIHAIPDNSISSYNDTGTITLQGIIADEPEVRDRSVTFKLKAETQLTETGEQYITGTVLITTTRYSDYHYGDFIRLTGNPQAPQQYNDFDYKAYLAVRDIYTIIRYPEIEVIERDRGNKILACIYSARNAMAESIERALHEPQSSIAKGIFLGIRSGISQSIKDLFVRTGTSHILAISGLHLTIIIGFIVIAGGFLFGRRYNIHLWLALIIIWIYAIFTGMGQPIIRSAIMGSIFLIAGLLGRQRNSLPALTFAAAIMLGIQPKLIADASFQLSYLSMCGLILIYPQFKRIKLFTESSDEQPGLFQKTIKVFIISFVLTIAVLLGIWPLISYYFGIVPVAAIPATIFILPSLPLIIIATALTGAAGLILPFLAMITGWLDWLFISYFLLIVRIFDALPLSAIELRITQPWQVWLYYFILVIILLAVNYFDKIKTTMKTLISFLSSTINRCRQFVSRFSYKWTVIALAIITVIIWISVFTLPDDKLHVSVLDVGQGDAILIQTPAHRNILIDGGPSPQKLKIALGKKMPFWDRKIDMLIITQPQSDHIAGLVDLIGDYKIERVVQANNSADSVIYNSLIKAIENNEIPVTHVHAGQSITIGDDIAIEIVHPPETAYVCKDNNADCKCLVTRLTYGNVSFLFTADIPEEVERYLVASRVKLKSTVLKVAHHGSQTSSCLPFLQTVNMKTAVISAGIDNIYGHPSLRTIGNLAQVLDSDRIFLTSRHGTVEYITDGTILQVRIER